MVRRSRVDQGDARNTGGGLSLWRRILLRLSPRSDLAGGYIERHPSPGELTPGRFLAVRSGGIEKSACFRCPGGCGQKIMRALSPRRKPYWTVFFDWRGRPTVSPSVRQTNACVCHFWIKRGSVEWCRDTPKRSAER
ncbi:DUF6527 family protein [Muricoccus vinaceus]|uniref:DUF6527 family protein n=1 Tax=Muricoccus vinaceus TaxID=424704 RepID=A0ABV6IQW8_9PROT